MMKNPKIKVITESINYYFEYLYILIGMKDESTVVFKNSKYKFPTITLTLSVKSEGFNLNYYKVCRDFPVAEQFPVF